MQRTLTGDIVIYFIQCGEFVKIGFSEKPDERVRTIATSTPHGATVLAVYPGTRQDECRLHRRLAAHRHCREWFRYCEEIAEIVKHGIPPSEPAIAVHCGPILAARLSLRESQQTFAKRFGVHQGTLSQWETDGPPVGGSARKLIALVLADIAMQQTNAGAAS